MNSRNDTVNSHNMPGGMLPTMTFVIACMILLLSQTMMANGIKFYHSGYEIDKRTSYNVFEEVSPEYRDHLDIEFDMANNSVADIHAETGYVLRIGLGEANENLIFNLFYDNLSDKILFRFNQEGKSVLIAMDLDKDKLTASHWFHVKLRFDLKKDELTMDVNGTSSTVKNPELPDRTSPFITFGKSDYIIDVPAISIGNLHVSGGGDGGDFIFPLSEKSGETVHDSTGKGIGKVNNAYWLMNDSYKWEKGVEMSSPTQAGVFYDIRNSNVYYLNADSIQVYNTSTGIRSSHPYREKCPVPLLLANCFIDPDNGRLFVYEALHKDNDPKPTIASLDLNDFSWRVESDQELKMQLHHHDYFYSPKCKHHVIFGGFGNMKFSNKFYVYTADGHRWLRVDSLSGDKIAPRYFSAVGYQESDNSAYVFGGMGNESREQTVGRRYYYDLYKIDLTNFKVSKLWDLKNQHGNTVPARGMVMAGDSVFYVLRYAESVSNSTLKLYKFSIADGSHEILGDSIPIKSDKITTNAHLYYNKREGKLIVTVQESPDDVSSTLKVYSLAFPPVSRDEYDAAGNTTSATGHAWVWAVASLIAAAGAAATAVTIRRRRSSKAAPGKEPDNQEAAGSDGEQGGRQKAKSVPEEGTRANAVYLFGDFTVFDKERRDITYMFTTRLKQILCLTLQHSDTDGISSGRLSSLMWPDKDKDKVKNSRGVAVNHLRKILAELDGAELRYESGRFKFSGEGDVYCDYLECVRLLADNTPLSGDRRERFLRIVSRGKFLKNTDEPVLDNFKHQVEMRLDKVITDCIRETYDNGEYEASLGFCRAAFNIDPLNESALAYTIKGYLMLRKPAEARSFYHKFTDEYHKITGELFAKPFDHYSDL